MLCPLFKKEPAPLTAQCNKRNGSDGIHMEEGQKNDQVSWVSLWGIFWKYSQEELECKEIFGLLRVDGFLRIDHCALVFWDVPCGKV